MNVTLALGPSTPWVVVILAVFILLFFMAWAPIERGRRPNLRTLRPLNKLQEIIGKSAENGKAVHYSPGTGGFTNQAGAGAAETLSGLTTLSAISRAAARSTAEVMVTTNDSLTYLIANDVVQTEYAQTGRLEDYKPTGVRQLTQSDPLAYSAGVAGLLAEKNLAGNIMLGRLDSEYLLAGDQSNRRDVPQVVGSSRVEAMPLMLASAGADNTLLGEEVFVAPAYLERQPAQLASVAAQDRVRVLVLLLIVIGIIATTVSTDFASWIANNFLR